MKSSFFFLMSSNVNVTFPSTLMPTNVTQTIIIKRHYVTYYILIYIFKLFLCYTDV